MGWIGLIVFGFLGLSVIYLVVAVYSRSVRRERLEREWDETHPGPDRDAFIAEGLAAYEHSLCRRLIVLVYIVPALGVMALIYLNNFE